MSIKLFHILLASLVCLPAHIYAQPNDDSAVPETADLIGRTDFSIPQSPAFTVLGIAPEQVIIPTSYRSLALSLLEGVDAHGEIQTGIAIDTKPYFLARGAEITLDEYRTNSWVRQLSRMQLSYATSSSSGDTSKADRHGLSLRWTPWDKGDPRMDYIKGNLENENTLEGCRRKMLTLNDDGNNVKTDTIDAASKDKKLTEADIKCRNEVKKRNWNAASLDLGIGGFRVDDENMQVRTGFTIWSSLALPIGKNGQFIAHLRFQNNELSSSTEVANSTVFNDNDTLFIGGRLRYGNEKGALMIEATHTQIDGDSEDVDGVQYLVGAEFRILEGFWIQLAYGNRSGDLGSSANNNFYSGQLRWAFNDKRLLQSK